MHRRKLVLACVLMVACDHAAERALVGQPGPLPALPGQRLERPLPGFSEGQFPCTECHDPSVPVNKTRRPMEMAHQEIVLRHDSEHRWCFDCHAPDNRDKLQLADGTLIDYADTHRLCGQCHGREYTDWRAGVHGRRSASWDGDKDYLLCSHCHSAHAPKFTPMQPLPPPRRPRPGSR